MTEDRVYGGKAVTDRRRERQERFLHAANALFGTQGYAATSVPEICRTAGLSTRQFYQEFESREHLLRAVYDALQDAAMGAVSTAVLEAIASGTRTELVIDSGVEAFVGFYSDARRVRISFIEVVGVSPEFEEHRLARRTRWSDLLETAAAAGIARGLQVNHVSKLQWSAYLGSVDAIVVERALDESITDDQVMAALRILLQPGILDGRPRKN